jgi:hypothetical protein
MLALLGSLLDRINTLAVVCLRACFLLWVVWMIHHEAVRLELI